MTKAPILAAEELLNELMERNQENERPLPPEQLIRVLLEIDWDSDDQSRPVYPRKRTISEPARTSP